MVMKENFSVKKYRGSIFLSQFIPSDKDLIKKISDLLNVANATIIERTPQVGAEQEITSLKEWDYISPHNEIQIKFQNQKVDIERKYNSVFSVDSLKSFSEQCAKIFALIISYKPQKMTRLAIAPTFKYIGDIRMLLDKVNSFYSKNDFMGSQNGKLDFSQVYRYTENVGNKSICLNYFAKFFINNEIQIEDGKLKISDEALLNFDINTFPL